MRTDSSIAKANPRESKVLRLAFKEWTSVVDALSRGEQIVIFRKGGISEEPGGFKVRDREFLLFPTWFHQQRECLVPPAQARYDLLTRNPPPADRILIPGYATIVVERKLESLADVEKLRGTHIWNDEVLAQRFSWGREQSLYALAVRAWKLPHPINLPALPEYGGCKSWIELADEVDVSQAEPVLDDETFARKLAAFTSALTFPP